MRTIAALSVLASAASITMGAEAQRTNAAAATLALPVRVVNLPDVQTVAGTINVGNLPLDADGVLRVNAAPQRPRMLVDLLAGPIDASGVDGYTSPPISTTGYSRFGYIVYGGLVQYAYPEWSWGNGDSFHTVADLANAVPQDCSVQSPNYAQPKVCAVSGEQVRFQIGNYNGAPIHIDAIKVYLIP